MGRGRVCNLRAGQWPEPGCKGAGDMAGRAWGAGLREGVCVRPAVDLGEDQHPCLDS